MFRRKWDPEFLLIPVTVSPIRKGSINCGQLHGTDLDEKNAIAAEDVCLIQSLLETFQPLRAKTMAETPMRNIEWRVAHILRQADDKDLRRFAASLDNDLERWSPSLDVADLVARLLLAAPLEEAFEVIRVLTGLDRNWPELLQLIAPSWVDFRAADPIANIACEPSQDRCLAINGQYIDTLRMYVWRASGLPRKGGWRCVDINHLPRENPAPEICRQIDEHFKSKGLPAIARKDVLNDESDTEPILALLPGGFSEIGFARGPY